MKKTLIASLLAVASLAQAHELWVNVPAKAAADEVLKAEMGYGHEFPAAEPIACTFSNRCKSPPWAAKQRT